MESDLDLVHLTQSASVISVPEAGVELVAGSKFVFSIDRCGRASRWFVSSHHSSYRHIGSGAYREQ